MARATTRGLLAAVVLQLIASCTGQPAPTPAPGTSTESRAAQIEAAVEKLGPECEQHNIAGFLGVLEEGGLEVDEEEEEILLHYGFFLMTSLLVLGFLGGYVLERKHFTYVHEAGGHLLIGVFCGLVLSLLFGHSQETRNERQHKMINVAKFDTEFFFLLLLPPIIFEAGYNMQRRKFFSNIGAVCMYAFVGTLVSTVLIAGVVYLVSQSTGTGGIFAATAAEEPFNGLEAAIFGALISATDPVTVLAVFGAMGADLNLFSMVFGESVLNDAVAIVLYRTLDDFNPSRCGHGFEMVCPSRSTEEQCLVPEADGSMACAWDESSCLPVDCVVTGQTVLQAVVNFFVIFIGSTFIGSTIALFSALLYKHTKMYEDDFQHIEMVLLVLFPYMAWMLAEACLLSGIVSVLFCGILMAHYTTHNLHPATEEFSRRFFKTCAFMSESFVFIYMGLATFTYHLRVIIATIRTLEYEQDWTHWPIIVVAIIAMLVSRIANVYPNSYLINLGRKEGKKVPMAFQHIMWFSGLRGAIAFALALKAAEGYAVRGEGGAPGAGPCILTMTLSIVIFTVLSMGGSIFTVLNYFDSPAVSVFEKPEVLEDDANDAEMAEERKASKALGFDRKWFKPFFTWRYQDEAKSVASERDPRWSATNRSGIYKGKGGHTIPDAGVARPIMEEAPEADDLEREGLLTTSV